MVDAVSIVLVPPGGRGLAGGGLGVPRRTARTRIRWKALFLAPVLVLASGAVPDRATFRGKSLREQLMSLPGPLREAVWQSGVFGQAAACRYPDVKLAGVMVLHSALIDRLSGRNKEIPLLRQRLIARANTMQSAGRGASCPAVFAAVAALSDALERSVVPR